MEVTPFVCDVQVWKATKDEKDQKKPMTFVGIEQCKTGIAISQLFPDFLSKIIVREDTRVDKNPLFRVPENTRNYEDNLFFSQLPPGNYKIVNSETIFSEKYGTIKTLVAENDVGTSFSVWSPPSLTELLVFCEENNIVEKLSFLKVQIPF